MAWTLLLGFVALTLVFVWMLLVRFRIGSLQDQLGTGELDTAIRQRRAEGVVAAGVRPGPGSGAEAPRAPVVAVTPADHPAEPAVPVSEVVR
jgi:hypothetical protein